MNTFALPALLVVAAAGAVSGQAAAAPAAAKQAAAPAAPAAAKQGAAPAAPAFGPHTFGPGVNNPAAFAPHPALLSRAEQVANVTPNVRVFVDVDGTVELTNQFGQEIEVLDSFGRPALEVPGLQATLELQEEAFERQQELARSQQQHQSRLLREHAQLMARLATLNAAIGPARGAAGAAPARAAPVAPAFRVAV